MIVIPILYKAACYEDKDAIDLWEKDHHTLHVLKGCIGT
jgi:hypothetical protein